MQEHVMARHTTPKRKQAKLKLDRKTERRILRFINDARSPQQIVDGPEKPFALHSEHRARGHPDTHEIRDAHLKSAKLLKLEPAGKIIEARERKSPIHGFLTLDDLLEAGDLTRFVHTLSTHLSTSVKGDWSGPHSIPGAMDRPVHAALLRTGDVVLYGGLPSGTVTHRYTPDPA
ncbi:MAG: hypothetical protein O7A67_06775, partial [SAR324 cluster bacterium]|nr:hypothetical protein [SAR324 cluster bacterium]